MEAIGILSKPILPDEIEWKIQSYTKDKSKTIIVPYVTARCVMERFDAAFGVMGWQTQFTEITDGFICNLTVKNGDSFVSKEDGANKTNIEPVKGGISDALKRAAHQFGLGRCLYSYPRIFVLGEHKYIPDNVLKELNDLVMQINSGVNTQTVITLPKQSDQKPDEARQKKRDEAREIISRSLGVTEVDEKWNGKIYGDKYIFIDNVKIQPPEEQLNKLKTHQKYKKDA